MKAGTRYEQCRKGHGVEDYRRRPNGKSICLACNRLRYRETHPDLTPRDALEAFWSKVDKSGDCWVWTGTRHKGYGQFTYGGRLYRAHRFALSLSLGREVLPTEYACHHCDNPPCVRPDHLFEGSGLDNIRDASAKGRMATGERNVRSLHPFRGLPGGTLTPGRVEIVRLALAEGITGAHIARFLGLNEATVSRIANGSRHAKEAA